MDPIAFVTQVERDLLTTAKRSSEKYLNAVLGDDFIEIGQSGQIYNKAGIITALRVSPQTQASITDISVKQLSQDLILASYKTTSIARGGHPINRHSLWKKMDEKWQLLYHEAEIHNG